MNLRPISLADNSGFFDNSEIKRLMLAEVRSRFRLSLWTN